MGQNPWDNDKVIGPAAAPPTLQQKRVQEYERAAQQSQLDAKQDVRADTATGIALTAEQRAQKKFEAEQAALAAGGGVPTTDSENTSIFLTNQLGADLKKISEINQKYPEAGKPGWVETAGEWLGGPRGKALATSDEVEDARIILSNRYRRATDVLLKMATGAASTEDERKNYVEMYSPQVTDTPAALEDKKQMLIEAFQSGKLKAGPGALRLEQISKELDQLYGAGGDGASLPQRSINDIATPEQSQKSSTLRRTEAPVGMSEEHALWVRQNPNATPRDYVEFRKQLSAKYKDLNTGNPYSTDNLSEQNQDIADYLKYYRDNPNAEIPGLMQEEPLTQAEQLSAGVSDLLGEGPTTGLTQFANAMSFGGVEGLASNSQKRAMNKAEDRNDWWALGGDLAGSIAPTVALEKGIGKLATQALGREAPVAASLFANAGYEGARGANAAEDGSGLSGAAIGALMGGAGAMGGRLLGKGAQSFQSPETVKAVDDLLAQGTDLTTIQRLGGGRLEELGQGLPIVRGAREGSVKSWNLGNVNDALSHVGEKLPKGVKAGTEANDAMNQILNAKYSELRPKIVGDFDQQFRNSVAALAASGKGSKLKRDLFTEISDVMRPLADGYDGNLFKDADSRLRALSTDWMKATADTTTSPSTYHEMGRLAEKIRKQLRLQVERNTPEVAQRLKALDRGWAKAVRIENATNRALKSEGVYAPGQMLDTVKQLDTSLRKGASSRGKAFGQKQAMEAAKVLGSKPVPETGSWLQTGGAGYALTRNAALAGLIAASAGAAYTPGFKRVTQALLTGRRPEVMQKLMKKIPPEVLAAVMARRGATESEGDR
jgi:hypothetical protein